MANMNAVDVPIMLSPELLPYEDILKLNPFYEELRRFWHESSESSENSISTLSTIHSSNLDLDPSFPPLNIRSVTSGSDIQVHTGSCQPKQPQAIYQSPSSHQSQQIACFGYGDESTQSPLRCESSQFFREPEILDANLDDKDLFPVPVTSHKKLFGANGWLGNTTKPDKLSKKKTFGNLRKKIKQQVEDLAGDVVKVSNALAQPPRRRPTIVKKLTLAISLDPPTQARLYSEMEVMICVSANKFLVQQYKEGRLSTDSINKLTKAWGSKNRPQVLEFQFDQATQRDLILANIRTLRFNGETSTNPVLLNSNLHNWKAIVKEMSVRTFCSPDSAIRKHMHDIHKILEMLGAPFATFMAFRDLQMRTLATMKEHLSKNHVSSNPPGDSGHRMT